MKIDFSTILLVIVAVIPGLFAQRSRNLVAPRSLAPQGTSAELAELVALGVATHGVLVYVAAVALVSMGVILGHGPGYYLRELDSLPLNQWAAQHSTESLLIAATYVFISFFISHWLGFIYGIWRLQAPLTTKFLGKAMWLRRFGVQGLLGEQPIIYEVLHPLTDNRVARLVFVEVEMKGGLGYYSGQLSKFAIVGDEEPHRPIFLINAYFKKEQAQMYRLLDSDGLMIDLADVATLLVKQVVSATT